METLLWSLFVTGSFLIVYHHAVYPWVLKRLAAFELAPTLPQRSESARRVTLPSVTLVIPAHNEAGIIREKLRNLAFVDYPTHLLSVWVVDDGSSDNTVAEVEETLQEPALSRLRVRLFRFGQNRGKVAVLNDVLPQVRSDLTLLSDASALVSIDALRILAHLFEGPAIGAVSGTYRFLSPGSQGEAAYWEYQTRIKCSESATGSTLGAHGALYAFRSHLFAPLEPDTINDDFILPMRIVEKGFRCLYEPRIVAVELEKASLQQDSLRRRRISAGNFQQALRLCGLLHPKHGAVAFNFASGKLLRVLMPWCLLTVLLCTLFLSASSTLALVLLLGQLAVYAVAALKQCLPSLAWSRPVTLIHYLVAGHMANAVGCIHYLTGQHKRAWKRVTEVRS